jgi:hypothetical protein
MFTLVAGEEFRWSPQEKKVFYNQSSHDTSSLLHEMAHAILGHAQYNKDIELIEMERDAWNYAATNLAPAYQLQVTNEDMQDALDTYRDWLHARSTCPNCKASGVQTKKYQYKCIACATNWRVNEARVCALRRYTL